MCIIYDPDKRLKTFQERGLDFERAKELFAGHCFILQDTRHDYAEPRFTTVGKLDQRMVVIVWTPIGLARRIISMRKANEREQKKHARRLD